jgi:general secretion pathway protein A
MYLEFFHLREKPFSYLTPNPRFFYYAPQYLSVKRKADYVVSERSGHLYIHGAIGSGKTTLLKTISQMLDDDERNRVNFLNAPNLKTANALLRRICSGFEVKTERSYSATLENLTAWLVEQHRERRFPVLIVDEAQNVVRDGLKTLHYLMTYVTNDALLLMIVLCGQEELASRIERFPEIKSRMYPSALSSLGREESEELVRYRWQVASIKADNPLPFDQTALDAIFDYSKGLPREICKLCDLALLAACAGKRRKIRAKTIAIVARGLALKGGKHGQR